MTDPDVEPRVEGGDPVLRRRPQQARSRARLASMLAAADRVLVAEGANAVTTTRVATEAGVSIGTVYHYLPDREAVLHALAEQYLTVFEEKMDDFVGLAKQQVVPDLVGTLVDGFVSGYRALPGFRALWFGAALSPQTAEADRRHKRLMSERLRQVLLSQGIPDDGTLLTSARVTFLMADAVVQAAFRDDPDGDEEMLSRAKAVLDSYLRVLAGGTPGGRVPASS